MTPEQALQRVMVRLLYDPTLVARLYGGETPSFITAEQASMLRAHPPQAWGTDPYRASRTLQALIEEYPASSSLIDAKTLHAFFRHPVFHNAIMNRRVLAEAFGQWLQSHTGPIAQFEQGIAIVRRRKAPVLPPDHLCCSPNHWPMALPTHTLSAWQDIRNKLGENPLQHMLSADFSPFVRPRTGPGEDHWIVVMDAQGALTLSHSSSATHGLLMAAMAPISRADLCAHACTLGADDSVEAAEIIDAFLEEGLLIAGGGDLG